MGRFRISTRGLILAVAVVGFDAATMTRAVQHGRAAHSLREYAVGFGLVLLVLNLLVLALAAYFAGRADGPPGSRLTATPPPMVILGLYAAVLSVAILSVLFFSGRF